MRIDVEAFDPHTASDDALTGCFEVQAAAVAHDNPEDPAPTRDAYVGRLRVPPAELGPIRRWLARCDGRVVGVADAGFPGEENAGITRASLVVHPAHRRRGVGTALVRCALPVIAGLGRTTVVVGGVRAGGPGEVWAVALGCQVTDRAVMQTLLLHEADTRLWVVEPPTGYRIVSWMNVAPEPIVTAYAAARPAIHDAPTAGSAFVMPNWTVDRIRDEEREFADRGVEQRVTVAVSESTGEVAGLTSLLVYPHKREFAYVGETSVVAAHRGRGLGRCVKGALTRWITAERPDLDRVYTTTAASNTHMININEALGYSTGRTMIRVEHDTEALLAALA